MGVTFGLDVAGLLKGSELEYLITDHGGTDEIGALLRKDVDEVKPFILKFTQHRLPPMCDNISMCLFFQKTTNANDEPDKVKAHNMQIALFLLWKIYEVQSV